LDAVVDAALQSTRHGAQPAQRTHRRTRERRNVSSNSGGSRYMRACVASDADANNQTCTQAGVSRSAGIRCVRAQPRVSLHSMPACRRKAVACALSPRRW
jgi:hypothetical protein